MFEQDSSLSRSHQNSKFDFSTSVRNLEMRSGTLTCKANKQ